MPAPVSGYRVSTPYGRRNARLWRWLGYHTGDDYACPPNTPVRATRAGRVDRVAYSSSYGRYVRINHGGVTSWYCHLNRQTVKYGRRVAVGTLLGYSGATGNVTGPHVHYEERRRNIPRRPVFNRTAAPKPKPKKLRKISKLGRPTVGLARLQRAARIDPPKRGTPTSYRRGVKNVEKALWLEGLLAKRLVDGHYGTATKRAYAAWQRRLGYKGRDADGIPGFASLRRLAIRRGFKVGR